MGERAVGCYAFWPMAPEAAKSYVPKHVTMATSAGYAT
jgi:hypothetical protein